MKTAVKELKEVGAHYLLKCQETLEGMRGISVLKTDVWNEIRPDIPGNAPIVGNVEGVKSWTVVEVMSDRTKKMKEMYPKVNVVNHDLIRAEFPRESFDAILSPGTLSYMPFSKAVYILDRFMGWLKNGGRVYVALWVGPAEDRSGNYHNPNEGHVFNMDKCEDALSERFKVSERIVIYETIKDMNPAYLIGYKCSLA